MCQPSVCHQCEGGGSLGLEVAAFTRNAEQGLSQGLSHHVQWGTSTMYLPGDGNRTRLGIRICTDFSVPEKNDRVLKEILWFLQCTGKKVTRFTWSSSDFPSLLELLQKEACKRAICGELVKKGGVCSPNQRSLTWAFEIEINIWFPWREERTAFWVGWWRAACCCLARGFSQGGWSGAIIVTSIPVNSRTYRRGWSRNVRGLCWLHQQNQWGYATERLVWKQNWATYLSLVFWCFLELQTELIRYLLIAGNKFKLLWDILSPMWWMKDFCWYSLLCDIYVLDCRGKEDNMMMLSVGWKKEEEYLWELLKRKEWWLKQFPYQHMEYCLWLKSTASLLIINKLSSGKAIGLTSVMELVIKLLTTVKLLLCNTV